eukprot:6173296-Pleurochrysis_carterae.AAC.1
MLRQPAKSLKSVCRAVNPPPPYTQRARLCAAPGTPMHIARPRLCTHHAAPTMHTPRGPDYARYVRGAKARRDGRARPAGAARRLLVQALLRARAPRRHAAPARHRLRLARDQRIPAGSTQRQGSRQWEAQPVRGRSHEVMQWWRLPRLRA